MERLLNIKEAAEFLNVSEITVRRWTNQGLLNCYRVGKRRARRFRPQDLTACLEGRSVAAAPGRVALETHTHSSYRGRFIENPYGGHHVTAGATVL